MTKNHDYNFELILIAGVTQNGVIGKDNQLPWKKLKGDLTRFAELTTPHPVIMGRNTWESLPEDYQPLPDRLNMVLTRNEAYESPGAYLMPSLEEALESIEARDPFITGIKYDQVFIIGGARVYEEALPLADRLELTEVHREVEGDTFFPGWDRKLWNEENRVQVKTRKGKNTHDFVTYIIK